jgi:hypothetical protein
MGQWSWIFSRPSSSLTSCSLAQAASWHWPLFCYFPCPQFGSCFYWNRAWKLPHWLGEASFDCGSLKEFGGWLHLDARTGSLILADRCESRLRGLDLREKDLLSVEELYCANSEY